MQRKHQELQAKALILGEEASNHKKAVRYHRRRLKECLTTKASYEAELGRLGIKLEIQKKSL